jgi:hypothetical protein
MGSYGQRVNLKQYRRLDGKWQFVPVAKAGELHLEFVTFLIHSWLIYEVLGEVWQSKSITLPSKMPMCPGQWLFKLI